MYLSRAWLPGRRLRETRKRGLVLWYIVHIIMFYGLLLCCITSHEINSLFILMRLKKIKTFAVTVNLLELYRYDSIPGAHPFLRRPRRAWEARVQGAAGVMQLSVGEQHHRPRGPGL